MESRGENVSRATIFRWIAEYKKREENGIPIGNLTPKKWKKTAKCIGEDTGKKIIKSVSKNRDLSAPAIYKDPELNPH